MATLPDHPTAVPVSGFEHDLRLVREARSRTLDQIQQETRIPLGVLKRFEDGELAGDPTYGPVYLVALLRSYARAVGIPQADVLAAHARAQAGTYRGELHPDYDGPPPTAPAAPAEAPPAADVPAVDAPSAGVPSAGVPVRPETGAATPAAAPPAEPRRAPRRGAAAGRIAPAAPSVPATAAAPTPPPTSAPATPVEALRSGPAPAAPPPPVSTRVARPSVPGARRSYDKNWRAILGLFAVVVVALGVAVYLMFRPDAEPDDDPTTAAGVAAQIDSAAVGAGVAGGRQFQTPISVAVTARGNGLQSFRVSRDGDRTPHWIQPGQSQTFTADSSLVLWGEGSSAAFTDAVVDLQGVRWTPADGRAVTISRATGQRLLDSLATPAAPAPADAPDAAL